MIIGRRIGTSKDLNRTIWICFGMMLMLAGRITAQVPIGLDALEQVADWPLDRQGILYRQISSADPVGGDLDGSASLYRQDSLYVVFDQQGPGCVYRIWIRNTATAPNHIIKFFFDGETFPTLSTTVGQLCSGLQNPFLSPLVGNASVSSGGYYCYLPLPFEKHLKIAFINSIEPHQIAYHLYPGWQVTSYSGQEDPGNVVAQWQNTGTDPKDPSGNITESGALAISPGQTQTVFSRVGGGSITGLQLTPNPNVLSLLESLLLRFYWDDSSTPQVECTFASFFGSSLGLGEVDGLPLGVDGSEYYCFFSMPFWQEARMEIYNASVNTSVNLFYTVTYKTELYPDSSGYFNVFQKPLTASMPLEDMMLAEIHGHGSIAGMAVSLTSTASVDFLHGDMFCYLDGLAQPVSQGTDFDGDFNAGNYFATGSYSLPMHGAPFVSFAAEKKVSAYRFLLGDLIPFRNSITLRAEHGNANKSSVEYSAVVYAFCRPEIALILTDHLDVGDPAEEEAHNYSVSGGQTPQDHYYAYPGSYDDQFFSDTGWAHFGHSYFTVSVDPENTGVRLVRRRDGSLFPQAAIVSVNGDSVGVWWDGDYNFHKRWSDSIFEIPSSFTTGAATLDFDVAYYEGTGGWSEYYYWVYSHVPPRADATPPSQVLNLTAENMDSGAQMRLIWDAAADETGVSRYRVYRDTSPNVQPTEDYLVDETPLTDFTDNLLSPGTWYYYRVSAVDYSNNEGTPSGETGQRTSCNYLYEGENFPEFSSSSGDGAFVENMAYAGDNWSNQFQLFFGGNEVGDYFTVAIMVAESDTYDVSGYFTQGPFYGFISMQIDDLPMGDAHDLYSPFIVRTPQFGFGTLYLEAGSHQLRFETTGKNVSSTSYGLGVDDIILTSHYLLPVSPENQANSPLEFHLAQNYPNPFNSATRMQFSLAQSGFASLTVYNSLGQRLAVLRDGWLAAGLHTMTWNAEDYSSGIYFIKLQQGSRQSVRKVLLLK